MTNGVDLRSKRNPGCVKVFTGYSYASPILALTYLAKVYHYLNFYVDT